MIGKKIRSFSHLYNSLEDGVPRKIIFFNGNMTTCGYVVKKMTNEKEHRNSLFFLNNRRGNCLSHYLRYNETQDLINSKDCLKKYRYAFEFMNEGRGPFSTIFGNFILLLPENIDDLYMNMLNNNKKLLSSVYSSLTINDDYDCNPLYIFTMFSDSPNLFAWAIKVFYKSYVSLNDLYHISCWVNNYGKLSNKLNKGTVTAYNKTDDVFAMQNEMITLKRIKRANDVINTFNTCQKKLLKSRSLSDKDIFVLNKFSTLSYTKKQNFIRKVSTIENVDEIISKMSFLINLHYEWDYSSFMSFLKNCENLKYEILFDENNIVVIKCLDYETIKHLAKTTNWCISKNKAYWNQYMCNPDTNQCMLFDFNKNEDDEYSIIGFTTNNTASIIHAHSFTNNNLMNNNYESKIRSFKTISGNIHKILDDLKLPPSVYNINYSFKYEWNEESFMSFLEYAIGDNYDVILHENNKFVFFTNHNNVRFIFGKNYTRIFTKDVNNKHLIFVDFSKNKFDPTRIVFSIIHNDLINNEETSSGVYNINCSPINNSFNKTLDEFNLPYDTICRVYDAKKVMLESLRKVDYDIFDNTLKDESFIKTIKKKWVVNHYHEEIYMYIHNSIFELNTIEIIELIYSNDLQLSDFLTSGEINNLICEILSRITHHGRGKLPSDSDIDNMYTSNIDINTKMLCGYFMALNIILKYEKQFNFNNFIRKSLCGLPKTSQLLNWIVDIFVKKLDFSIKNNVNDELLLHLITMNDNNTLESLLSSNNLNEEYQKVIKEKYSLA